MKEQKSAVNSEEEKGNSSLLEKIKGASKNEQKNEEAINETIEKYMVFSIKGKKYALFAEEVREIIAHSAVFYVPFTPPYIKGFINRHGEPYTVIDLMIMLERENLDSSTFLVLSRDNDQLALLISEVIEIVKQPESELHRITSRDTEDDFFIGSISPHGREEIFVLNLDNVLKKLEGDISAY